MAQHETEEWRLGVEPGEHPRAAAAPSVARVPADLSHQRLERPLYVFTAGHLGWLAVVLYALATRLIALGGAPMTRAAARSALSELRFLGSGLAAFNQPAPLHSTWVHFVAAALMSGLGAGDFSARLVFALSGLVMVGAALAMRSSLGRAGSLALAGLLALSPSAVYFSRTGAAAVPVMAMALLAIAIFMSMRARAGLGRSAALGAVLGLMLSAGPEALPTAAMFLVGLLIAGLWYAATTGHAYTRALVWWRRSAVYVVTGLVFAVGVWLCFTTNLFSRPTADALSAEIAASWRGTGGAGYAEGLGFYLPIFGFYEFLIVILGLLGALLLVARKIHSALAGWSLIWACLSVAFFLWVPARAPGRVLEMLAPLAILGGFAVDYLHHAELWRVLRYPLGILALLTVYVCVLTSFAYPAPDAAEAPWAPHALLFWSVPATTLQTIPECALAQATARKAANATVTFSCDDSVLRWYLRGLAPVADIAGAGVAACAAAAPGSEYAPRSFDLSASWRPDLETLTVTRAIRFYFTAHAWNPMVLSPAVLYVNGTPRIGHSYATAHTTILSPPAAPGASPVLLATPTSVPSTTPTSGAAPAIGRRSPGHDIRLRSSSRNPPSQ